MTATAGAGPALLRVRVHPHASRDEIVGWREDALRIRVSAPPRDGRANAAVVALVAEVAGVARSAVSVVGGARSRTKLVRVAGVSADALRGRLGA
jgi:uncharacterized protein